MSNNYDFRSLKKLIGDEAPNDDNYYRDPSHVEAIRPQIASGKKDIVSQELAEWIRQKKFGQDVRESLARFIEWISVLSNENKEQTNSAIATVEQVADNFDDLWERYETQIANNTDLNEVIDSRLGYDGKKYKTLKERLDKENNKFSISGDGELGGNEPRELFKAGLKVVKDRIDTTKFNIALGTDFHVDERDKPRYPNAKLAYSHFNNLLYFDDKVDVTIVNGDNVDAMYSSLDRIKQETEAMVSKFLDNDTKSDVFIHLGNHDDGSGRGTDRNCPLDGFVKLEEYKEIFRTKQLLNGEKRKNGSLYYFKDYPDKKIRLIGLYTEDITETITNDEGYLKYTRWLTHTIQQEQMDWLIDVALKNVPSDYHTVVIGHCPLYHGWTDRGAKQINHEFIKNVLLAFQRGTSFIGTSGEIDFPLSINCDFSGQGSRKLVGFFGGHTHSEMIDDWDGVKNITCLHSVDHPNSKNAHTTKEDAQTIISIDTKTNTVNLIGYGRATNRSYNY